MHKLILNNVKAIFSLWQSLLRFTFLISYPISVTEEIYPKVSKFKFQKKRYKQERRMFVTPACLFLG